MVSDISDVPEWTQVLHNMLFSSIFHLGHLPTIVFVVTNPCNKLRSSGNQIPCISSPFAFVSCLFISPKVFNLAFTKSMSCKPQETNLVLSATWGLLQTAAHCRAVVSKLPQVTAEDKPGSPELSQSTATNSLPSEDLYEVFYLELVMLRLAMLDLPRRYKGINWWTLKIWTTFCVILYEISSFHA